MITCNQCIYLFITHDPRKDGVVENLVLSRQKFHIRSYGDNRHEMCLLQRRSLEKKLNLGGHV